MHGATDGALLVLPEESSDELEALLDEGYRFVVVDPRRRLAERGSPRSPPRTPRRRPGGAAPARARPPAHRGDHRARRAGSRPRTAGAATAPRSPAAGILPDPELEVEGDFEIAGGYEAARALLDLPEPPTAIFAFNDNLAVGAIHAARERGLGVPEDLSVVGFDDVEIATVVARR